ncbi:hypothetical protein [Streptomyces sp. NPDC092952]|uniref:hypothetical protein n=1 Tax=Streptomyces sp. NPDC092952 TaxID=3366018 RepID=UPI003806740A
MSRSPLCTLAAAAALAVAALCGTGTTATAAPAHAAQNPAVSANASSSTAARPAVQGARTSMDIAYDTWSYWIPDSRDSSHAGIVRKGRHDFYCYINGANHTAMGRTSSVWLRIFADDSGNEDVWVSKVYLTDASNNVDLPRC